MFNLTYGDTIVIERMIQCIITNTCFDNMWYIYFNLLVLCHCLASKKRFSIKWQQLFRTYLNTQKTNIKYSTKLKLETKCGESFSKNLWFSHNKKLPQIFHFNFIFHILINFHTKKCCSWLVGTLGSDNSFKIYIV
jgi:hypothetical protein